jgi:Ca2+-binding RTX toxin-like protein
MSTNNQIIQAIAVDIACGGDWDATAIDLTQLSGDLQYAIDYLGDENANTLTGTSGNEIFVAGAGDDTLIVTATIHTNTVACACLC